MTTKNEQEDRSTWAIGGTTMIGLGVGIIFIKTSILISIGALFIGIGTGLFITSLISNKKGVE